MPEQLTSEEAEVLRIAGIVWPDGAPALVPRSARVASGTSLYSVIPSIAKPRLLAPVDRTGASARAMLEASDALTARQRASRLLAWGALRLGAGRHAKTLLAVADHAADHNGAHAGDSSLQVYLERELDRPLSMVLGIGTPRTNRKPVVRLNDSDGTLVGFAKVGINPLTNGLVRREHEALLEVGAKDWHLLRPPDVIHFGRWRDHNVLVLSPVPTRLRPLPPRHLRPPAGVADELARAWSVQSTAFGDSPFMKRLLVQGEELSSVASGRELTSALMALAQRFHGEVVRTGSWHGDFTPWNMIEVGGRWSIWDWEQFAHDVPLGMDLVHYEVNVRTSRGGMTEAAIVAGLHAATAQRHRHEAELLVSAYLGAIATRYTLGEQETGADHHARIAALMRRLLVASIRGGA